VPPAAALDARVAGIDGAVRHVLGEDWPASAEAVEAADLAATAAAAVDLSGRPLAAANTGIAVPDELHLRLWQALTTLREHRGDGHSIAHAQREVDGVTAHVFAADTDRLALRPWQAPGDAGCGRLAELLAPVRRAVVAAGDWPSGNLIGAPDADRPSLVAVLPGTP
jgi:hypothetical protein